MMSKGENDHRNYPKDDSGESTSDKDRIAQLETENATLRESEASLKSSKAGLSGHATKLKTEFDQLKSAHGTLQEQLAALETDSEVKLTTLQTEFEAMKLEHERVAGEYTTLQRKSELGVKIRTDFPELAGFYDDGLLRVDDMEEDELTEYLNKYSEKVKGFKELGVEEVRSGSTPPAPSSSSSAVATMEEAQESIQKAIREHGFNSPEYNQVYQQYVDSIATMEQGNR